MSLNCKIHYILFGLVLFLFSFCDVDVTKHDIDDELAHLMIEYDLPSISACVIKNDSIVWHQVYGYSNREHKIKATHETIYHLASISKLFIATAYMQLEEQGIVDINQDINNYLPISIRNPNFPDKPITAKMLLTHNSSLASGRSDRDAPGIWETFKEDQAPAPSQWLPGFIIPSGDYYHPTIWKNYKPTEFELYSNIGCSVLAYIVEQKTGQSFKNYCKEHIFEPLAMHNTSYHYSDLEGDNIATLYQNDNKVHPNFDHRLNSGGGVKTTVQDMARFLIAYMNGGRLDGIAILAEDTIEKILMVQNRTSGICLLWRASLGGWYGHKGGLDAGASTTAEIHSRSKTAFIIFCNKPTSAIYRGHDIYGLVKQKANEYIDEMDNQ